MICQRSRMSARSAIRGMCMIMSRWKAMTEGVALVAWFTEAQRANMAADRADSSNWAASAHVAGGDCQMTTRRWSATVRCMRSQMAFDWGFMDVVGTSLIPWWWSRAQKYQEMNSRPLSWTQRWGRRYRESQWFSNLFATCWEVFESRLMSSARLETGSMQVRASKMRSSWLPVTRMVHEPMQSIWTSSQEAKGAYLGAWSPITHCGGLVSWQMRQFRTWASTVAFSLLPFQNRAEIVSNRHREPAWESQLW